MENSDTMDMIFKGRLTSEVKKLDHVFEMQTLSANEDTQVELDPLVRVFPKEERDDVTSIATMTRQRLVLSYAIKKMDGKEVSRSDMLKFLGSIPSLHILTLANAYFDLERRELEAANPELVKNSSATPSPA